MSLYWQISLSTPLSHNGTSWHSNHPLSYSRMGCEGEACSIPCHDFCMKELIAFSQKGWYLPFLSLTVWSLKKHPCYRTRLIFKSETTNCWERMGWRWVGYLPNTECLLSSKYFILFHLQNFPQDRIFYFHFVDEEIKFIEVTYPMSHSQWIAETGFKSRSIWLYTSGSFHLTTLLIRYM